jgi:hypothetical protein
MIIRYYYPLTTLAATSNYPKNRRPTAAGSFPSAVSSATADDNTIEIEVSDKTLD